MISRHSYCFYLKKYNYLNYYLLFTMSKKTTNTKKKQEEGGVLPKIELLFIFIFFLVFITWTMSKCGSVQEEYAQDTAAETSSIEATKAAKPKSDGAIKTTEAAETAETPKVTTSKAPVKIEKRTVLYVLLDGLKLRKGHHLDSSVVKTLKLNDEVYFLGATTDFKQKINLGDRVAFEPWVKVRAYTGHEGWVYGAGVHYFKPKTVIDTLGQ